MKSLVTSGHRAKTHPEKLQFNVFADLEKTSNGDPDLLDIFSSFTGDVQVTSFESSKVITM